MAFRKAISYHSVAAILIAVLYGAILASLPLEAFKDRSNYLVYAEHSWAIFHGYWDAGILKVMANEPLWLILNAGLATWLSPENVLRLIIFIPATVAAFLILRQDAKQFVWLIFILLIPSVSKNFIIHLRQGVAIAIFLSGWMADRQSVRFALLAATPFIHASFFFVLGLLGLTRVLKLLRLAADVRTILYAVSGILIGSGLGWLASFFGARQAGEYDFTMPGVSGLGFIFWVTVFIIWCFQGRNFLRRHALESGAIIFYLGTYFLVEVTARIFESVLVIVILAGLGLTGWRRQVFLGLLLSFAVLQWMIRMGQPGLGFGIV